MNSKFLLSFFFGLISLLSYSQTPDSINYQAIARDVNNGILRNKTLTVQFQIFGNALGSGTPLFQETHQNVSTNAFGLFNIEIGSVNSLKNFNWGGKRYLQVNIDTLGGTGIKSMGITPLVSVPYALYAKYAENVAPGTGAAGWTLSGNNASSSDYVGTNNNQDFILKANNIEKARAMASGGLFVRDTLHIGSSSSLTYSKNFEQIVTPTLPWGYTLSNGSGSVSMSTFVGAGVIGSVGAGIGTTTNTDFHLFANSAQVLSLSKSGNVGIGTANPNPNSMLEISSTSKGILIPRMLVLPPVASLSVADKGLLVFNSTTNLFNYFDGSNWVPIATGNTNSPWVRTSPHVTLTNSGDNVGIGTTTPSYKLEVVGGTKLISAANTQFGTNIINNSSGTGGALQIKNLGTSSNNFSTVQIIDSTTSTSTAAKFALSVKSYGSTASNGVNNGLYVEATGGGTNKGIVADINATTPGLNIAIYGRATNAGSGNWAGYFDEGDLFIRRRIKIGGAAGSNFNSNLFQEVNSTIPSNAFGYTLTDLTVNMATFAGANVVGPTNKAAGVGTTSNHDFYIFSNGSASLMIDSTGNVGVGKKDAKTKLSVDGPVAVRKTVIDGTGGSTIGFDTGIVEILENANATVYLPATNGLDDGSLLILRSRKSINVNVNAQSGDLILFLGNVNGVVGILLNPYMSKKFYKSGTFWVEY